MQTIIQTPGGNPATIGRNGRYFTLMASSEGGARVKALDPEGRELFDSYLLTGNSIDFDFVAAQLQITTEKAGEVSIFWSMSKLNSAAFNIRGAAIMKTRAVALVNETRLNSIQGQNKEIRVKAVSGDVKLSGFRGSRVGGWTLEKGKDITLPMTGDVYASGPVKLPQITFGTAEKILTRPNADILDTVVDSKGGVYYTENKANGGCFYIPPAQTDAARAAVFASGVHNRSKLIKWREKVYLMQTLSASIAIHELSNGVASFKFSVPFINAQITVSGSASPVLSLDGRLMYIPGTTAYILDMQERAFTASKAMPIDSKIGGNAMANAYGAGFLVYGSDGIRFLDENLQSTLFWTFGNTVSGGSFALGDTVWIAQTTTQEAVMFDFDGTVKTYGVSVAGLFYGALGDLCFSVYSTELKVTARNNAQYIYSFPAGMTAQKNDHIKLSKDDATGKIYAFFRQPNGGTDTDLIRLEVGQMDAGLDPELVEVMELY